MGTRLLSTCQEGPRLCEKVEALFKLCRSEWRQKQEALDPTEEGGVEQRFTLQRSRFVSLLRKAFPQTVLIPLLGGDSSPASSKKRSLFCLGLSYVGDRNLPILSTKVVVPPPLYVSLPTEWMAGVVRPTERGNTPGDIQNRTTNSPASEDYQAKCEEASLRWMDMGASILTLFIDQTANPLRSS